MRLITPLFLLAAVAANAAPPASAPSTEPSAMRFGSSPTDSDKPPPFLGDRFDLLPGETVVFAGQTNMVHAQKTGWLEAQLAVAFAAAHPRFRTMAWEGDTVYGQWRDLNFGSWSDQLRFAGTTTIIAQYGQMESLEGVGRLADFVKAYAALLDQFQAVTPRIVLISPMPFEAPKDALAPNHAGQNEVVAQYARAIRALAKERGCLFVDLIAPISTRNNDNLTHDGLHLTVGGQSVVARIITSQLGLRTHEPEQLETLRQAILAKNRLWFENWRPMNWAFAYGDRQHVPFGHEAPGHPLLKIEFEDFKPLIAAADQNIHEAATGLK